MTEPNPIDPGTIQHVEEGGRGAFFIERNGERVAEMTYRRARPTRVTIDHTEVDEELSGQGIARKMLDALVEWARATNTRVVATCPYARAQFQRDPSIGDVLA
jgi:uncharacterized protein